MHVLAFGLDERTYALPLERVREVVRAVAIRPLPGAPEIVEGVILVRGAAVPVLDVRSRFGHPRRPLDPDDRMILATAAGRPVALRVDRAIGLERIDPLPLKPGPGWSEGAAYVAGAARVGDDLVLIHDLDTFLSASEEAALDAATPDDP